MSMIRHPVVYTATPLYNRLVLGRMFSYVLRDAADPRRMADLPLLVKTVHSGSESGSAYADATFYQLPVDCGNTDVVDFVAEEDEDNLYLNQVLSLYGMEVGEQIIVAMDVSLVDHGNTNGALWCWGSPGDHSMLSLQVNSGGNPRFLHRPRKVGAAPSTITTTPTSVGTDLFTAFNGQGRFSVLTSIVVTAASGATQTVDVEILAGNGTLSSRYTATGIDLRGGLGADAENPGISGGSTMSAFVGLSVGSQGVVGGPNNNFWGRGTSPANTGKIDVIHGWRGTYDANLAAAVLAEMYSTNALDYPPSLAAAP